MLTLHPTLGKNSRGEFKHWLAYWRTTESQESWASNWRIDDDTYLNYIVLPWIFEGEPDIETFDAMAALGILKKMPDPWQAWPTYRKTFFGFFTERRGDAQYPSHYPWKWVIANGVSGPAVLAAIKRKERK